MGTWSLPSTCSSPQAGKTWQGLRVVTCALGILRANERQIRAGVRDSRVLTAVVRDRGLGGGVLDTASARPVPTDRPGLNTTSKLVFKLTLKPGPLI